MRSVTQSDETYGGLSVKKRNTPEQELKKECSDLLNEVEHWKDICENGCSDPFWPDGANMNLTRNHIMYHKWKIEFWCAALGLTLPVEYYIPTPPEVPEGYMANLKQERRVERLISMGTAVTTEKPHYDDSQMSFA